MPRIAPLSGFPAAGLRLAAAIGLSAAIVSPAASQSTRPAVVVDWSALDALGPAKSMSAPVTLHPPAKRQVAVAAPRSEPPRPPSVTQPVTAPPAPSGMSNSVAASPPPQPAPKAPAPAVTASAATTAAPALAHLTMVRFAQGRSEIPLEGQDQLNTIASQVVSNPKLRLQLVAYASGAGEDAIAARRLSLARAVQMRSYLISKGIAGVRMDVRALGNRDDDGGPADRVDVVILDR
jgi:outer membrane protein OmpA-like peptidoglycan-associated protein